LPFGVQAAKSRESARGLETKGILHLAAVERYRPERRIVLRGTKGSKLAKKGPKLEHISLPWRAADALIEIEPEDGSPNDLVFVPMRGERMSVNRDWNRIRLGFSPWGLQASG
jgi:integrase